MCPIKSLFSTLPYLTLPYREDVLPPSAEASNGPNAHPQINRKVTKSPSAVLTWVQHLEPSPSKWEPTHLDLLTNMHSWYLQENVSSKAHKHIHPGHHDQQDSRKGKYRRPISESSIKPQNPPSATLTWVHSKIGITSNNLVTVISKLHQVHSPSTPCILTALLCNPGCLLQAHPVY